MRKQKSLVRCTHPHFCYEWDSMFITPLMPEFKSCICMCSGEGAIKMSDFAGSKLSEEEKKSLQEWLNATSR